MIKIRRLTWPWSGILSGLLLFSCSGESDIEVWSSDYPGPAVYESSNAIRLTEKDSLRILAIGNSYTWDATRCLKPILQESHIKSDRYCVYLLTHGGASLEYWSRAYANNDSDTIAKVAGQIEMPTTQGILSDLFAQNWDVVILQQYSGLAPNYYSYNPYLKLLANAVRMHCTNKDVLLAWNLIHSYYSSYKDNRGDSEKRWRAIANAAKWVMASDSVDILIPIGTAIQNARNTDLFGKHELTRDGTHLAFGCANYIASCVLIEKIFYPVFNYTCKNSHYMDTVCPEPDSDQYYEDFWIAVTDSNRSVCHDCAIQACARPYELSNVATLNYY